MAVPPRFCRRGFTLVELLTVVVIIGLLVAILVPAVSAARESARSNTCRNNLRQIGAGLAAYAVRNRGACCSGAFDWLADGAVTEVGWVADLVNSGVPVGEMLCPTNRARLSETYHDLLSADTATFDTCVDRLGRDGTALPDGSIYTNPCRKIAGAYLGGFPLAPGSPQRLQVVAEEVLGRGFNTNYTASWFLARGGLVLDDSGNLKGKPGCPVDLKQRHCTTGPLQQARVDTASKPASFIPIVADGLPVRPLPVAVGAMPASTMTVRSLSAGPVLDPSMGPPSFPSGTPRDGPMGWWATWNSDTLQDYRAFGPVHRGGECNILFADGSVRPYVDANDDGLLNNGFTPDPANHFMDDEIELPEEGVASVWSLRP